MRLIIPLIPSTKLRGHPHVRGKRAHTVATFTLRCDTAHCVQEIINNVPVFSTAPCQWGRLTAVLPSAPEHAQPNAEALVSRGTPQTSRTQAFVLPRLLPLALLSSSLNVG